MAALGAMNSDEEYLYDCDSGNESSGDDVGLEFDIDGEAGSGGTKYKDMEDYPYEVLSTEDITRHMIECIKEVNGVVNVSSEVLFWGIIGFPLGVGGGLGDRPMEGGFLGSWWGKFSFSCDCCCFSSCDLWFRWFFGVFLCCKGLSFCFDFVVGCRPTHMFWFREKKLGNI